MHTKHEVKQAYLSHKSEGQNEIVRKDGVVIGCFNRLAEDYAVTEAKNLYVRTKAELIADGFSVIYG